MFALILDDEADYREHLKVSLERMGLRTCTARTAPEALSLLQQDGPDLAIVDVRLAGSADGLEFASRARERNPDMALIVVTGFTCPEYEERSRTLGALAYLEKPFDLSRLELHVHAAVDRHKLLREIHTLEQQLAEAQSRATVSAAAAVWPLVFLSEAGGLLFATPAGQAALEAVTDPRLPRPVQAVDADLWRHLRGAVCTGCGPGRTTLDRRDGELSEYVALVRTTTWRNEPALSVLFVDPVHDLPLALDRIWAGILGRLLALPPTA